MNANNISFAALVNLVVNLNALVSWAKGVSTKLGAALITTSEPSWKSKKNPFVGRVVKVTFFPNVRFCSYENMVDNRVKALDKSQEFTAKAPSWFQYVDYPIWGVKKSDPTQQYLRINYSNDWQSKPQSIYFLDGVLVTDLLTLQDIKDCIREYSAPKTQTDKGLDDGNQVVALTYKVSNIRHFGTPTEIKEIFEALQR